jgi:hypothetical protein
MPSLCVFRANSTTTTTTTTTKWIFAPIRGKCNSQVPQNIDPPLFDNQIISLATTSSVPSSSLQHQMGPNSFNLKMEAAYSSNTLASNYNTWCQNSEDYNLNNPHRYREFRSSEIWCCVIGRVVPDTFMALCSFKISGTTHPTTQCHIQEDTNSQKQCVTTSNLTYMQAVRQH